MIEVLAWAPTRDLAIAFMQSVNVATVDADGNIQPIAEVQVHPSRPNETIAVLDKAGNPVAGFHFNLRFYGTSESTLMGGLPQTDANGNMLGLFDRTVLLQLVDLRTGVMPAWEATKAPIPPGYETPAGVRAFDPATVTSRTNVWA